MRKGEHLEIQMRNIMRYHYTPIRMDKYKNKNADENAEELDGWHNDGRNVKVWCLSGK